MDRLPAGFLITGTDTDVGKTYVTCLLARHLRRRNVPVGLYKPVCSGATTDTAGPPVWDDVRLLSAALNDEFPGDRICPQCFAAPLAPPAAAAAEGRQVDRRLLRDGASWWRNRVELLLVEGVGGLLSPVSDGETVADLAADLGLPLIVVAADRLGMINHTLLTLETAAARGLNVAGVIVNRRVQPADQSAATNVKQLARLTNTPLLGVVEHDGTHVLRPSGEPARMDWVTVGHVVRPDP